MMPLRPVGPADAALLAAIHAECFAARWDAKAIAEVLAMPGAFGLVAADQGFILCRTAADEAEILTICVCPPHRGHGLAKRLLDAAISTLAAAGAQALFLEVAADNAAAIALYTDGGFREVGRRRRYYESGADALVLRRDL